MKINYLSFFICILFAGSHAYSQVGINTDDPKAQLDIEATSTTSPQATDGLLVPRVQTFPVAGAEQHSMIIYLSNGVGANDPGFYYWDNTNLNWTPLIAEGSGGTTGDYWSLDGNAGTNSTTDFIGTTDNQSLVFGTSNVPRLRLTTTSQLEFLNSGKSVFIGRDAGRNDDLNNRKNVFIGHQAAEANTEGEVNTVIGHQAFRNNETGSNNVIIGSQAFGLASVAANNIAIGSGAGAFAGFFGTQSSNLLYIETGTSQRPLIGGNFTSDRVGINRTITDLTHTLTVGGNVFAQTGFFTGAGGSYPDYVFEQYFNGESAILPSYEFMPLDDVAQFIKANGHLPGVKSYEEVKEDNFNIELGATSIKNLEKIEELFLYTIELNDQVKTQTKEIEEKDTKIKDLESRIERLEKLILED